MTSISTADASLILLVAKHGVANFKTVTTSIQARDPTLNEPAIRMRWTRLVKKLEKVEAGGGADDAAAGGEKSKPKPKPKPKAVKGPKDGVTKAATPKKPRKKAAVKGNELESAMRLEYGVKKDADDEEMEEAEEAEGMEEM